MLEPFVAIPVAREGRSLVEWLDESIRELESKSNEYAKRAAFCPDLRDVFVSIEQARRTLSAVRAAI